VTMMYYEYGVVCTAVDSVIKGRSCGDSLHRHPLRAVTF
jgi:hypothetical protein